MNCELSPVSKLADQTTCPAPVPVVGVEEAVDELLAVVEPVGEVAVVMPLGVQDWACITARSSK